LISVGDPVTGSTLAPKSLPVAVEASLARDEPLLDCRAAVERAAADFDAWRASPGCVPAIERPFANPELVCKLRYSQIRGQDCAGARELPAVYFHRYLAPFDRQSETRMT
jgi:hypothetical protein